MECAKVRLEASSLRSSSISPSPLFCSEEGARQAGMVGTSSYSSPPCDSFGSLDDVSVKPTRAIKFLCSYGGKILPRYPDGKLRYVGGHTRLVAVDRSISFSELQVKLRELCGWDAVSLRCQLPKEDLDALVSVTSDEDLANLVEEYDIASRDRPSPLNIRAFLFLTPPSSSSSSKPSTKTSPSIPISTGRPPFIVTERCVHRVSVPAKLYSRYGMPAASTAVGHTRFHSRHHHGHGSPRACSYLVHHGSHLQLVVMEEERTVQDFE
ncbi:PB1 domain containing protein [Musa troglodytarum]|uniref:PB1 domain containing protein n=1 Tax=Musa troglodytarum TaxID=320322 RepID=A0A9E7EMR3_9LILI|nr:PB1 domain containing protein [Musa troglodytarum]